MDTPRINIDLGFNRILTSLALAMFDNDRISLSFIAATVITSSIDANNVVFTSSTSTLLDDSHRPNNVPVMLLFEVSPKTLDTITTRNVM